MKFEEDEIYLAKIDEIGNKIYEIYNKSGRRDLVMIYETKEDKIYSYIYEDFKKSLNQRSRDILKEQYQEAMKSGKIVLFIRDEERRKFKSYTI